jgi:glycosyltransferase involved in cell wall biosynthesis
MSTVAIDQAKPPARAEILRPRRVCLVTEAAGGGVGRHFLDLAEGLVARGVEVVAIYSPGRCDASFRARRASLAGIRFVESPMRRALHPLDALDCARLVRLIRDEGPFDLVHGHSSKGGALARLAARWLGIPSVYTPHAFITLDPTLPAWKRRLYGRIERWLARHAAAVITVSRDEATHARALGIDPRKIHTVHNGIAPLEFPSRDAARSRLGLSPVEFVIGFVGRFVSQKAPELLVDALAIIAGLHPHTRLVLIGSGPLEPIIRRRIHHLGLESRVLMPGDSVAAPLMPAFDVFCLPSRYEGLPYVLLEALAAGLPIVTTRVGGAATCVDHGQNGFILESGDASQLASALSRFAADPPLRHQFAATSKLKSTHFSADRMIDETLLVYQQVLALVPRSSLRVS